MKRKIIIQKIMEEQNKIIDNLTASVERYTIASDIDEESTHDPEDFSQQTQAKDMQLRYEKMRNEANLQLHFLENELEETHQKIEAGSLVETDKNYFFVGISVPVIKVEEKEVISFSDKAPIFEEIKGKNISDTIRIGDNTYIIQTIH